MVSNIHQIDQWKTIRKETMIPIQIIDPCIRELIDTESNYVHALEMILNNFADPLRHAFRKDDYQLIFGHIKYFHQIHTSLQADLKRSMLSPTMKIGRISTCFLNYKEKFFRYGEYCASIGRAQSLLDELASKNDEISLLLEQCQQKANDGKFKLRDLLSLPMQRILKYHLLLADLINNTSATSNDYTSLMKAHGLMVDIGYHINEVKRDTEAINIINDIEESISGLIMPPNSQLKDYGRLITDGMIKIIAPPDQKSKLPLPHDTKLKQKRYVFVFDKVMLLCKLSGLKGYDFKDALFLNEFEVDSNPYQSLSDGSSKLATKEKWSYNFNLVCITDKTTYHFYTKTLELKTKWIDSIRKAIDNVRPQSASDGDHEFLMHTFEKASPCDQCGKLLSGLYYQGYRCRVCFLSVHKKCLTNMRQCGPALPPSPSLRSNCSDSDSSSIANEYCNISNIINTSWSFKEFQHQRKLGDYAWYCGRMGRDQAQTVLEEMPDGTFLIRVSPKHNGSYVISLKFNSKVNHMRIYISEDNQLYLSPNRYFRSVVELVSWYENNSLVESFHMLDAKLEIPLGRGLSLKDLFS